MYCFGRAARPPIDFASTLRDVGRAELTCGLKFNNRQDAVFRLLPATSSWIRRQNPQVHQQLRERIRAPRLRQLANDRARVSRKMVAAVEDLWSTWANVSRNKIRSRIGLHFLACQELDSL